MSRRRKRDKARRTPPPLQNRGDAGHVGARETSTARVSSPATPRTELSAVLPALIIAAAVLWDWVMRFSSVGWNEQEDISIFLYTGQRLAEGILNWTQEFYDNKPLVNQFLFLPPALFGGLFGEGGGFKVWYAMGMAAALIGAYSVYVILRELFSPQRGFSAGAGHYAGIYGGVFTVYLLSTEFLQPYHVNGIAVCMALAAAALTLRVTTRPIFEGGKINPKAATVFLLACFCGSLAAGIRPYLAFFVGLIPAWVAVMRQLERERGGFDYLAIVKFFVVWNLCLGGFALAVNVLPFIITGTLSSFFAGLEILGQQIAPHGLDWILHILRNDVYRKLDGLSAWLFYAWAAFLVFFLLGLAGGLYKKALALDLAVLTLVAPFSILAASLAKNFWEHYAQLLMPFIAIGAVSIVALLYNENLRHLNVLIRGRLLVSLLALWIVTSPASDLMTSPGTGLNASKPETIANLRAVQARHGLASGDFLAPYNQYAHAYTGQNRHGFPNVSISVDGTIKGWYRNLRVPPQYRLPRTFEEYCHKLDEQGPTLLIYYLYTTFAGSGVSSTHLANCQLRNYDRFDVSADARLPADITYYFIRRDSP